jgi:hypothetical protein
MGIEDFVFHWVRKIQINSLAVETREFPSDICVTESKTEAPKTRRWKGDQGLDQVHCRQRESQSGRRIFPDTVSRSGLERRRRITRTHGRHTLILKRRRAECEHHLQRHGLHADRGEFVGDASRIGSGKIKSEGRSKKEKGRGAEIRLIASVESAH